MSIRTAIAALLRADPIDSCIDPDETVVFFPTCAALQSGGRWEVPVHGWIYQPTDLSRLRRAAFRLVRRAAGFRFPGADLKTPLFRQRVGAFLADNERHNRVNIQLGGVRFALGASRANGHFEGMLDLPAERVQALMTAAGGDADGWLRFRAVTRSDDPRAFDGRVLFLPPTGLSVISDIDDTIKVSEVLDRKRLLANTFLREFESVPRMAGVYRRWAAAGAAFHFVSASPWHLYPFLAEFLAAQGFPPGTFHLRAFRLMPRHMVGSLRPSRRVKERHAQELLRRFPGRRFVLVGDSGESDPELYAALARAFPTQVRAVCIRNVTDEATAGRRWQAVLAEAPGVRWRLFKEAADVGDVVDDVAQER
jgi:hypothetical protein